MKKMLIAVGLLAILLVGCGKTDITKTYERSESNRVIVTYYDVEVKRLFSSVCQQNKKRPSPSTVENSRIRSGLIMLFNDHVRPVVDYEVDNTSPSVAEAAS